MKRMIRWLCLLFLLSMVVYRYPASTAAAETKVTKIDVEMREPELGEKPAGTVTVNGNTGAGFAGIQWYGEFERNGGFKANEVYSARIDFKIQDTLKDKVFVTIEPENMRINGVSGAYGQIGCEKKRGWQASVDLLYFPLLFHREWRKEADRIP